MRKLALTLAAGMLTLGIAGLAMAASPSPSPSISSSPSASPSPAASSSPSSGPSSTPSASPSPTPATTTASTSTWSAAITPLNVTTGTATVLEHENGTGTITVQLKGLRPDAPWTVDIDAGTMVKASEVTTGEIAYRSGMGVERVSSDTFRVNLTAAEMKDFLAARSGAGVVVLVSDGTNRSVATFTGS
jgi:hypothetical protein